MKRLVATILCMILVLAPISALADFSFSLPIDDILDLIDDMPGLGDDDSPSGEDSATPAPNAPAPAMDSDSIVLNLNGESLPLAFDNTPEYSSVTDGQVQASFYAYGSDNVTLYELFLIFPDTVQPGMVITPEYAALINAESSVVLIVSDNDKEQYFFSSSMSGGVYPENSDYALTFDAVEALADGSVVYAGTLSATLVELDMATGETLSTLTFDNAPFRFTLGGASDARHADPLPTEAPNDMRKV